MLIVIMEMEMEMEIGKVGKVIQSSTTQYNTTQHKQINPPAQSTRN